MSHTQKTPWGRLLAEGSAIVLSILLAFWIDAYWQDRQDVESGRSLAGALASEVVENDKMLDTKIAESREAAKRAKALLVVMSNVGRDGHGLKELSDLGNVFVLENWIPDTDVYRQAVAAGQLLLINDADLRFDLAGYHSDLNRVADIVEDIRTQYFLELEPFLAKNTVYTDIAHSKWLQDIPVPPFSTDIESLSKNPELWSLIALRLEAEIALAVYLERAQKAGNELEKALLIYSN